MRPQNEQIYSIDTGQVLPFPNDLLRIRGRLDALRAAVLELARAIDANDRPVSL